MKKLKSIVKTLSKILPVTRAVIALNFAKWRADRLFTQTGKRFFVVWDPAGRRLVCMSYDPIPGRVDCYRYLRLRGCLTPQTRQQLQRGALYFSRSKSSPAMTRECLQARLWTLVALRARKDNKDSNSDKKH